MFVLVRHAHAGDKSKWPGRDIDRTLSTFGYRQARGLVATLEQFELRALFSSPAIRCRETLLPLAAARGLRIDDDRLLAPDASPSELFAELEGSSADGALFCTHGEVLDALAEFARLRGWTCMTPVAMTPKGGAWIVDRGAVSALTLRYLPPVSTG
ncbi:SixA phosphatase family protein [Rhodococcus chondri]|uniref:Phosphoglycerate mutase family protein n=1 Tax=Rhodococcus chondri TaxID=3065941 RepID=A0ABU7JYA9_9NOCA|nr:phosphoglycerate mutase family protein [Rhodococcus sp. CC-R104]MEE2034996.1 phosphoglycerate mutase family protein [Rhodococcus sp. CC-R104]